MLFACACAAVSCPYSVLGRASPDRAMPTPRGKRCKQHHFPIQSIGGVVDGGGSKESHFF